MIVRKEVKLKVLSHELLMSKVFTLTLSWQHKLSLAPDLSYRCTNTVTDHITPAVRMHVQGNIEAKVVE
jgi:hypothetical protein